MSGPMRILVVEDEPLIAMMLEDFIDALGKTCVGIADTVAAALLLVSDSVDAAILDVNLRGEKSFAVADALAGAGIPFVFATGGGGDDVPAAHRDRPTLTKPYTMDGVERAIADLK